MDSRTRKSPPSLVVAPPPPSAVLVGAIDAERQVAEWWRAAESVHATALETFARNLASARAAVMRANDWGEAIDAASGMGAAAWQRLRALQADVAFSAFLAGAGIATTFLQALSDQARRTAASAPPPTGELAPTTQQWLARWASLWQPHPLPLP